MKNEAELAKEQAPKGVKVIKGKLSEQEKIDLLLKTFKKNKLKPSNLFLPDDEFYAQWDGTDIGLRVMASKLLKRLKLKPKSLAVGFYDQMEHPGLYVSQGREQLILVHSKHSNNPFQCAAIMAHELMHYYLMHKAKIVLEDTRENELLTDLATIYSGFGILVINSFSRYSGWHKTIIGLMFGFLWTHTEELSFGYFKPAQYCKAFASYLNFFEIDPSDAKARIVPQANHFLPYAMRMQRVNDSSKTEYVRLNEKAKQREFFRKILLIFVAALAVILFWWAASAFGGGGTSSECQSQADSLKTQVDDVENQANAARNAGNIEGYNALVPRQNELVNQYNAKITECQ